MTNHKLLVLDIDDTIHPSSIAGPQRRFSADWQGIISVPERILNWFTMYQTVWLTAWSDGARDVVDAPVLYGSSDNGWWKGDALNKYLNKNPHITRVVWADDELAQHPDWTPDRTDVKILRISPTRGLTEQDADLIERAMQ